MEGDQGIEKIEKDGKIFAIVVRGAFDKQGCTFVSPESFPLQLGLHKRKAKEHVKLHRHIPFKELRDIPIQEFVYIESGSIKVAFYDNNKKLSTKILNSKDMVLMNCAHEVIFLEDTKMVELKQGPYRGKDAEKEYFG